jgi:hypothetical protein
MPETTISVVPAVFVPGSGFCGVVGSAATGAGVIGAGVLDAGVLDAGVRGVRAVVAAGLVEPSPQPESTMRRILADRHEFFLENLNMVSPVGNLD